MPYSYEVLKEIKGSPDFIWSKEIELHKLYKDLSVAAEQNGKIIPPQISSWAQQNFDQELSEGNDDVEKSQSQISST